MPLVFLIPKNLNNFSFQSNLSFDFERIFPDERYLRNDLTRVILETRHVHLTVYLQFYFRVHANIYKIVAFWFKKKKDIIHSISNYNTRNLKQ